MSFLKKIAFALLRWKYTSSKKKIIFGSNTQIKPPSYFEGMNAIGDNTVFHGRMGFASYIGSGCSISANIGRYTVLSNNIITVSGTHPCYDSIAVSPLFYSEKKYQGTSYSTNNKYCEYQYFDSQNKISVNVGNDVWIGANVTILGGISIGDGAVIGAGAVVTKNIEPYSVVVGVPAKEIKKRFNQNEIDFLLSFKWWDKDTDWILKNANLLSEKDNFFKEYLQYRG